VHDPTIRAALDLHDAWSRPVILRSDAEAGAFLRENYRERHPAAAPSVA
jgi:hypothetical protein